MERDHEQFIRGDAPQTLLLLNDVLRNLRQNTRKCNPEKVQNLSLDPRCKCAPPVMSDRTFRRHNKRTWCGAEAKILADILAQTLKNVDLYST